MCSKSQRWLLADPALRIPGLVILIVALACIGAVLHSLVRDRRGPEDQGASLSFALFARSVQDFLGLALVTFWPPKPYRRPPSLKRCAVMLVFLPTLALVAGIHWMALWLDELLFPRYRSIQVRAPVFVVGLPRSGTTHLHRVLARDREQFTVLRLWEVLLAPAICERKTIHCVARIDRVIGRPLRRVTTWLTARVAGDLGDIHTFSQQQPEEDFVLLIPILACFILIAVFPWSQDIADLACFDSRVPESRRCEVMAFYRGTLQRHLYCHGSQRTLLSKNVSFTPMVESLREEFPDARILTCLREPDRVLASQISSMESGWRAFGNTTESPLFRDRWPDLVEHYCECLDRLLSRRNARNVQCVEMTMLKKDLNATVRRVYDRFGLKFGNSFAAMLAAEAEAGRNYRSKHDYSLADYGLDHETVKARFADIWTKLAHHAAADRAAWPRPLESVAIQQRGDTIPAAARRGLNEASDLRIVFFSDAFRHRNGVGSYYCDLIEHLRPHVTVAEMVCPGPTGEGQQQGLSLPLPGDPSQRLCLPGVPKAYSVVRCVKPHVIVAATPGPYGILAAVLAQWFGARFCFGYHTQYDTLTDLYWNRTLGPLAKCYLAWLDRRFLRRAAAVFTNGFTMVDSAEKMGARRIEMIGTPIEPPLLSPPVEISDNRFGPVLFVGRLAPEKNLTKIFEAARDLPDIPFIIAGDGPCADEVKNAASQLPNLEYLGWVDRQGIIQLLDRRCEVLVLPSKVESFGTVAAEAMARERLVVVSNKCGIIDWPELAGGVEIFDVESPLTEKLNELARLPFEQRREKRIQARKHCLDFVNKTVRDWQYALLDVALQ